MRGAELPPFLEFEAPAGEPAVAVLPVPYERTTSWGRGAEDGPAALLRASHYVELYDEELRLEPFRIGIETLPPVDVEAGEDAALERISASARAVIERGRFLAAIGGEHTVTPALVRGVVEALGPDLGPDLGSRAVRRPHRPEADLRRHPLEPRLRDEPGARPRRVHAGNRHPVPEPAGGRADRNRGPSRHLGQPDAGLGHRRTPGAVPGSPGVTARHRLSDLRPRLLRPVAAAGDRDAEPGGGNWYQALALLRLLFEHKRVIAMDVVELAPIPDNPASDYTAARLLYKCIGYRYRQELTAHSTFQPTQ